MEIPHQQHRIVPHSCQQRSAFCIPLQDITGDGTAIDGIDFVPAGAIEHLLLGIVTQAPQVADLRRHPLLHKKALEHLKLIDGTAVHEIHNGHIRDLIGMAGTLIHSTQRSDPAFKQLTGPGGVGSPEIAVHRGELLSQIQLPVLVHGTGAVGIELTVFVSAGLLVVEEVNACHRQQRHRWVGAQDQLLRHLVKSKQCPIRRVPIVRSHHLAQDAVQCADILREPPEHFFGKQLGHIAGAHILSVVNGSGGLHVFGNFIKLPGQPLRVGGGRRQIRFVQGLQISHFRVLLPVWFFWSQSVWRRAPAAPAPPGRVCGCAPAAAATPAPCRWAGHTPRH